MSERKNITLECGADFVMPYLWKDESGEPVGLTGAIIEAQLREFAEDTDYYIFTCTHNDDGGKITITMPHEKTAEIPFSAGVYDVFATFPEGERTKVIYGDARIVPNVVRPVEGTVLYMIGITKFDDLPLTGQLDRVYFCYENRNIYRWNGTNYITIAAGNGVQKIEYVDGGTYRMIFDDGTYFDFVSVPRPMGMHDSTQEYQKLDVVMASDGASYIALIPVPENTLITDTDYWMQITPRVPTVGNVESVAFDADPEVTITGTGQDPVWNFKLQRGVTGNESIDDTAGDGDTDLVWSADKSYAEISFARNALSHIGDKIITWTLGKFINGSTGIETDSARGAVTQEIFVHGCRVVRNTPKYDTNSNRLYMNVHKYINGVWQGISTLTNAGDIADIPATITSIKILFSLDSGSTMTQTIIDNNFSIQFFAASYTEPETDSKLTDLRLQTMLATRTYIRNDTVEAICSSDLNNIPPNRIYGCSATAEIAHSPVSSLKGCLITFGINNERSATDIQMFITTNGKIYQREYAGNTGGWNDWAETALTSDITEALRNVARYYFSPDENYADAISNKLSNIPDGAVFNADHSYWDDLPVDINAIFRCEPYTGNYAVQTAKQSATGNVWERVIKRTDGSVYRDWTALYPVPPVKILALGDSFCAGWRNNRKGFVGDLGLPYKNIGKSGATLSNIRSASVLSVYEQLIAETTYQPDIIIANGGINDWTYNAPLGTIPTAPAMNDTEAAALDLSTVMGGTGYLFYNMIKMHPKAQRFFIIQHKIKKAATGIYCPTTRNEPVSGTAFNQQELHDALVAICNIYNVKVIDVYKDGMLNSAMSVYLSPTPYSDENPDVTNQYYIDADGVHPLALGYKECYLPLIREAIGIGTKNPVIS